MKPRAGFEPASPPTKVGRYLGQITGWKPDSPVFIPGYANAAETNIGDSNPQCKESVGRKVLAGVALTPGAGRESDFPTKS